MVNDPPPIKRVNVLNCIIVINILAVNYNNNYILYGLLLDNIGK